jgi:hypothetical protein
MDLDLEKYLSGARRAESQEAGRSQLPLGLLISDYCFWLLFFNRSRNVIDGMKLEIISHGCTSAVGSTE